MRQMYLIIHLRGRRCPCCELDLYALQEVGVKADNLNRKIYFYARVELSRLSIFSFRSVRLIRYILRDIIFVLKNAPKYIVKARTGGAHLSRGRDIGRDTTFE